MNDEHQAIEAFLDGRTIAVVGASRSRYKFGHQVLRCLLDHDYDAIPVNPSATRVAGIETVESVLDITRPVHGCIMITPPSITEAVCQEAIEAGIARLWMQPGAESPSGIEHAVQNGCSVIAYGPCLLIELGQRDH